MKKMLAACLLFQLVLSSTHVWGEVIQFDGLDNRIIGGEYSDQNYPWMVSIQRGSHFCGGVLITQDWVLTAAHCLDDKSADELTLYIGLESLTYPSSGDIRKADWFILHPDYNDRLYYSDLAIIKLDEPSSKAPIHILNRSDTLDLKQNEQLRVLGWGVTDSGASSNTLRQVDVSYQKDTVCNSSYPINSIAGYWDRSLCAGEVSGGKDSCQGDSGGPILVKANDEWALAGLVSWGSGCAEAGLYGVYSEVSGMLDWIEARHKGMTLLGTEKIGFIGKGRTKAQTITVLNSSGASQTVEEKFTNNVFFSIDESNWLLDGEIPNGYACDFTINAHGDYVGEHYGKVELDFSTGSVSHELNSKVLNSVSAGALDTQWQFFSGTPQNTDHSAAWFETIDSTQGMVMQSGTASVDGRSVLLTYLNGPVSEEDQFLKFEAQVNNGGQNYLGVYINEVKSVVVKAANWSTYAVSLDEGVNHVMFIYFQGDDSLGAAQLNNLRVCSDRFNDATCSSASGYYNTDDLSVMDDPAPSDTWDNVCRDSNYLNSDIAYASRNASDVIFKSESDRLASSKVTGGLMESRQAGGGIGYWLLLFMGLLIQCRFVKRH